VGTCEQNTSSLISLISSCLISTIGISHDLEFLIVAIRGTDKNSSGRITGIEHSRADSLHSIWMDADGKRTDGNEIILRWSESRRASTFKISRDTFMIPDRGVHNHSKFQWNYAELP